MRHAAVLIVAALVLSTAGCDTLFGSKQDDTTDEIFEEGRTPPGLIEEVEYVPLNPFFTQGGNGQTFVAPQDVYVGYDEFIYVVDSLGLHVLDRAGRPQRLIGEIGWPGDPSTVQPIRHATSVIQDRRLHLYVTALRDTVIEGADCRAPDPEKCTLPVVYDVSGISTGGSPHLEQILWHPFDDRSRELNSPSPTEALQDEQVRFTGVGVRADNSLYVSRRGPVNQPTNRSIRAQNAVLLYEYDEDDEEYQNQRALPLSPITSTLRSAVNPTDVLTFVQPPQRESYGNPQDLLVAQRPDPGTNPLRFAVLGINVVETINGISYEADTDLLQAGSPGDLYDEERFDRPSDLAYAADGSGYIYVLDAGKDSLFTFTRNGVEGVSPPPGASTSQPVPVSFGGTGDNATQFNDPQGVTYYDEIVYVADTGNDRIARFRLNTDFE